MFIEIVAADIGTSHFQSLGQMCIHLHFGPATHNTFPDVIVDLALMQPHPDHPEQERSSGTFPHRPMALIIYSAVTR